MKTGLPKRLYLKKGGIGQPKYCTQLNQLTVRWISFVSFSSNTKECNVLRVSLVGINGGETLSVGIPSFYDFLLPTMISFKLVLFRGGGGGEHPQRELVA